MMTESPRPLPSALAVARYILYLGSCDGSHDVDQFKVQKTLYFCQCWSLALRGEPLFSDDIQAWRHGPVVPSVYSELSDWGDEPIWSNPFRPCPLPLPTIGRPRRYTPPRCADVGPSPRLAPCGAVSDWISSLRRQRCVRDAQHPSVRGRGEGH